MIPQGWQPIGEPDVPVLSSDAKAVQAYIQRHDLRHVTHKTVSLMCRELHMQFDRCLDAVYEFRKWEVIMARRPKINKEQRTEMLRLHNEERYSVGKLASKYGCSQTAVKTALQAAKIEAEDEAMKHTGINPEFDAAVDEMIKTIRTADEGGTSANAEAEQLPADLEDCENGIPNTPLKPSEDKLPPVVIRAVRDSLNYMETAIEDREQRIFELQAEIKEFRKDIATLQAWKEAHT